MFWIEFVHGRRLGIHIPQPGQFKTPTVHLNFRTSIALEFTKTWTTSIATGYRLTIGNGYQRDMQFPRQLFIPAEQYSTLSKYDLKLFQLQVVQRASYNM
jgi:hypothetical protein